MPLKMNFLLQRYSIAMLVYQRVFVYNYNDYRIVFVVMVIQFTNRSAATQHCSKSLSGSVDDP